MEFCRSWYNPVVVCCKSQWSNQCASLFVAPVLENENDKGAGLDYGMPLLADTACTHHCLHWHPCKDELHHLYTQHSPVILSLKMMLITGSITEFSNSHIRLAVWSLLMLMIIELHIQYCPCLLLSQITTPNRLHWIILSHCTFIYMMSIYVAPPNAKKTHRWASLESSLSFKTLISSFAPFTSDPL